MLKKKIVNFDQNVKKNTCSRIAKNNVNFLKGKVLRIERNRKNEKKEKLFDRKTIYATLYLIFQTHS